MVAQELLEEAPSIWGDLIPKNSFLLLLYPSPSHSEDQPFQVTQKDDKLMV